MLKRIALAAFMLILAAGQQAAPCDRDPSWHRLDFWIGRWTVVDRSDGSVAGTSVIEKTLRGCAINVDWHDASGGGEIREIFYYDKPAQKWRQIWISDQGPAKQRESLASSNENGVQFLGEVREMSGGSHLDRSTVTPEASGRVHQLIEISRDGGKTWKTAFDAEYRRADFRSPR